MTHRRKQDAAERARSIFTDRLRRNAELPAGRRLRGGVRSLPPALFAALATAALLAPLAVGGDDGGQSAPRAAAAGDAIRQEVRNGTTRSETEIIGRFNATTSGKGGYVTRQSNVKTGPRAGGGAIYGCRAPAGGTAAGSAACVRASNLANGYAFEFASKSGPAGLFEVANLTDAPFATNATGLVANLNADRLDGKDSADFLPAGGKAADAETVDGKDSSAFLTSAEAAGLLPVAVVNVAADGTLRVSKHRAPVTGTPVVSHAAASNIYDIDLPGVGFRFDTDAVTCQASQANRAVWVNSIGGNDVRVFVTDLDNNAVEGAFYCSIFELS